MKFSIDESKNIFAKDLSSGRLYAISKHNYYGRIRPLLKRYGRMSNFSADISILGILLIFNPETNQFEESSSMEGIRVRDIYCPAYWAYQR